MICGDANTDANYIGSRLIPSTGKGSMHRKILKELMDILIFKQHNNMKNESLHHLDILLSNVPFGRMKSMLRESVLSNGPVQHHGQFTQISIETLRRRKQYSL